MNSDIIHYLSFRIEKNLKKGPLKAPKLPIKLDRLLENSLKLLLEKRPEHKLDE